MKAACPVCRKWIGVKKFKTLGQSILAEHSTKQGKCLGSGMELRGGISSMRPISRPSKFLQEIYRKYREEHGG